MGWWQRRKQLKESERRKAGYEYAAGQLLSNVSVHSIETRSDSLDPDSFDEGMRQACKDWEHMRRELCRSVRVKGWIK